MVRTPYLAIVVAGLVCAPGSARAQSPTLGGYRLGQTWESVRGWTMPCNPVPFGPDTLSDEKLCTAPSGVGLSFRKGVVIRIFEELDGPDTNLAHLWHAKWKGKSVRIFGEPDSVLIIDRPPEIDARWDRRTWCANVTLNATGVTVSLYRLPLPDSLEKC